MHFGLGGIMTSRPGRTSFHIFFLTTRRTFAYHGYDLFISSVFNFYLDIHSWGKARDRTGSKRCELGAIRSTYFVATRFPVVVLVNRGSLREVTLRMLDTYPDDSKTLQKPRWPFPGLSDGICISWANNGCILHSKQPRSRSLLSPLFWEPTWKGRGPDKRTGQANQPMAA
jgi:hypothetical protein